jgi:hypothetical protein
MFKRVCFNLTISHSPFDATENLFAWTTEEFVRVQYVHMVSHSPATEGNHTNKRSYSALYPHFLLLPATQHLPAFLLVFFSLRVR